MDEKLIVLGETLYKEYLGKKQFVAGKDWVKVAGQWLDGSDLASLLSAVVSGQYAEGEHAKSFAKKLGELNSKRHTILCNSGSSANLLAVNALMELYPKRKKVVTCSTGFPTTASAVLQNGGELVFVDVDKDTLNASPWQVMEALRDDDVGGVILAHTLGFPFFEKFIYDYCVANDKWYIADTCDALSSAIYDDPAGYYSQANTYSFYPAHHISTGEGGAVQTNDHRVAKLVRSYSEWGRDCNCPPGCDNTCGKRFSQKIGELPEGYDHKYSYERLGYNLKMSELSAALGDSQIDHVTYFTRKRRENYKYILDGINGLGNFFDTVSVPICSNPSPFGFPLIVNGRISKSKAVSFLESRKIMTRPIFAGNLTRHPAFLKVKDKWSTTRLLSGSDYLMENAFWIGCHPGMSKPMMDYVVDNLYELCITVQGG